MDLAFSTTAEKPPAAETPSTSTVTSAKIITTACMKSDADSARKPPRNVYSSTNSAPTTIMS